MTDLLTTLSILFVVAGPFLLVANRLNLPTVPFLILAGLAAGPFVDEQLTLDLARFGIALLVFTFGARIRISAVRTVLRDSELAALGQIVILGTLGVGIGLLAGFPVEQAVYLGLAAALSSTIVGTALIQADIYKNLVRGRIASSIQLVQDIVALVAILVLSAGTLEADPIATQLGYGVVILAAAVLANRYLFVLLGWLAGDSEELMMVSVVSLLAMFVGLAELAGISVVVGAFAAGIALRYDPGEYLSLFNGIESLRDFFVAVFLVTLGTLVAVPTVDVLLLASWLVFLTVVVKPAVTIGMLVFQGYETRSATLTSLSIDQVSEFALIIAIEALVAGLVVQAVFDAIILAAAATMITSSFTYRYDERIYRELADTGLLGARHDKIDARSNVPEEYSDHLVVVGYGRLGKRLVEAAKECDRPYIVVENDPTLLEQVRRECDAHVFGDSTEAYTWEKANVTDARLVVSTADSSAVSDRLLAFDFDADLILRTDDVPTARDLLDRGALYVVVTDLLASERLLEYIEAVATGELTPEQLRERRLADLDGRPENADQRTAVESATHE